MHDVAPGWSLTIKVLHLIGSLSILPITPRVNCQPPAPDTSPLIRPTLDCVTRQLCSVECVAPVTEACVRRRLWVHKVTWLLGCVCLFVGHYMQFIGKTYNSTLCCVDSMLWAFLVSGVALATALLRDSAGVGSLVQRWYIAPTGASAK